MSPRRRARRDGIAVGLVGSLGTGNLGNDGSLEAVVSYLRRAHPAVRLGFLCMGPAQISARYGSPATPLQWYEAHAGSATGVRAKALKVLGRLLDPVRTLAWIRRYDVVIVPGMGVLEASLPVRPWGIPYSLYWLGRCARLTGTRVVMVGVGADVISKPATRWFVTRAARLAHYRSYRDAMSREAMREMGVDVEADRVYPDPAFSLPRPPERPPGERTGVVGVGLMDYYGSNDDRHRADELHRRYLDAMKLFVRRLVDDGRTVRLFTGDEADEQALAEVLADIRAHRPEQARAQVVADEVSTQPELMRVIAGVDTVVAARYHNVLGALHVGRPTISVSYAAKHDAAMAEAGLSAFCVPADSVDADRLSAMFAALEENWDSLMATMRERHRERGQLLDQQWAALSALLGAACPAMPLPGHHMAGQETA